MIRRGPMAGLLLLAAAAAAFAAPADPARVPALHRERPAAWLSPGLADLAAREPARTVKVWVHFTDKGVFTDAAYADARDAAWDAMIPRARARRTRAGVTAGFTDLPVSADYLARLRAAGFPPVRVSRWLNAASVRVPAGRLAGLEDLDFVRRVTPVLVRRAPLPQPEPADTPGVLSTADGPTPGLEALFYGPSYNQNDQIGALDLHRLGYTGAGVRVLVLDTGFRKSHPVFQTCTNLVAERDYVQDDDNVENEAGDHPAAHGHGTGVWATLGGYAPGALVGPAWAAEFVLAKTEDIVQEVRAEEDNYVAALEWGDSLGVDVASASLSYWDFDGGFSYTLADLDGDTAVITVAVDLAVEKGICCVNAIGNSGPAPSTLGTPSDADSVIAVGAVDSLNVLQGFSSRGPTGDGRIKPEVLARGRDTYWASAGTGGYGPASGTSLATPLVGGLCALLKEARPAWTGAQIREALMSTADNAGAPDPGGRGWGLVDGVAAAAFGGGPLAPPRMTLPFALCDPADGAVVGAAHPKLVWSTSAAAQPGDAAQYTVYLDHGGTVDTLFAGPDTCLVVPAALAPGDTLTWWVHATGDSGHVRKSLDVRTFSVDAALAVGPGTPAGSLLLLPARPNPARDGSVLGFAAPAGAPVRLEIVSVTGALVRRFETVGTGRADRVVWDGRDAVNRAVAPGVYFYRVLSGGEQRTLRLVRLP